MTFQRILLSCADQIGTDPLVWENALPVLVSSPKDKLSQLYATAASKQLCVILRMAECRANDSTRSDPPRFAEAVVEVYIGESRALNNTGITAEQLCLAVAGALQNFTPDGAEESIVIAELSDRTAPEDLPADRYLWVIRAVTGFQSDYAPALTETPVVEESSGTVTCTGDGDIYYTTDGTTPTNLSTAYESPVAIAVGTTFSARSYESGKRASAVTTVTRT